MLFNVAYNNISSIRADPIWFTNEAGMFRKHGLDSTLAFARGVFELPGQRRPAATQSGEPSAMMASIQGGNP